MNTHLKRKLEDEGEREIIPDGQSIRISIMAMDSTQRRIAAVDERVRDNIAANQANLTASQRSADRAQGFADHFTAKYAAEIDNSEYGKHCQQISEAWQQAAA